MFKNPANKLKIILDISFVIVIGIIFYKCFDSCITEIKQQDTLFQYETKSTFMIIVWSIVSFIAYSFITYISYLLLFIIIDFFKDIRDLVNLKARSNIMQQEQLNLYKKEHRIAIPDEQIESESEEQSDNKIQTW